MLCGGGESSFAVKGVWKKGICFRSMEHAGKWDFVLKRSVVHEKRLDEDKYNVPHIVTLLKEARLFSIVTSFNK